MASASPEDLPGEVLFRTRSQSFNRKYEFVLRQNVIWYRTRSAAARQQWQKLPLHKKLKTIKQISSDDEYVMALDEKSRISFMKTRREILGINT